jgi:predicted transcriptional regulator
MSRDTVLAFMEILQKKGILVIRSIGSNRFYSPVLSRDCFPKKAVRDWLGSVFDRKPNGLFHKTLNEGFERG